MVSCGFWVAKATSSRKYWQRAVVPILIFTFVHGLRFARDQDYNSYYPRFMAMSNWRNPEEYEFIFAKVCNIFHFLGLNYATFIFLLSFFLIASLMGALKEYKKALPFIFIPLFWEIRSCDNLIRWYMGMSFIFTAIYLYNEGRTKFAIVSCIASTLVHSGYLVVAPLFMIVPFLKERTLPPRVSAVLFIILIIFGNIGLLSKLSDSLYILNFFGNEKIDTYVDRGDDVLNGEFGLGAYASRSITNNLRVLIAYLPGILWGKDVLSKYKNGICIYNLFIIGVLTYPLFSLVEILDRINSVFLIMSIVVIGVVFHQVLVERWKPLRKFYIIVCLSLIANIWPAITILNLRPYDKYMLFMWNANGREYIPGNSYPMTSK